MPKNDDLLLKFLDEQILLERVSPKLEQLKNFKENIVIIQGGRGAGAKSHGVASLLIQKAQVSLCRIACLREIQNSLEESVYRLMVDKIAQLRYSNWTITRDYLQSSMGSRIIFRGLKDLRASQSMKGLEGYTDFWLEEAATISEESLQLIIPTLFRNEGAKLWITYNPELENDPVTKRFWSSDRQDILKIRCEPGKQDNPWWSDSLTREMQEDYKLDADEADHVWGGHYRKISKAQIFKEVLIKEIPENSKLLGYGLDWGFSGDPLALSEIWIDREENYYFNELIYQTNLTNQDLIVAMKLLQIDKHKEIIADSAEPKSIEDLYRAGYNIKPAKKEKGSVIFGIKLMQSIKFFVTPNSKNSQVEFRKYEWMKDRNGEILPEPIDAFNHFIDSVRYFIMHYKKQRIGVSNVRSVLGI